MEINALKVILGDVGGPLVIRYCHGRIINGCTQFMAQYRIAIVDTLHSITEIKANKILAIKDWLQMFNVDVGPAADEEPGQLGMFQEDKMFMEMQTNEHQGDRHSLYPLPFTPKPHNNVLHSCQQIHRRKRYLLMRSIIQITVHSLMANWNAVMV